MPFRSARSPSNWGTPRAWGRGTADPWIPWIPWIPAWFVPGAAVPNGALSSGSPHRAVTCSPITSPWIKRELFRPWFQLKQYSELNECTCVSSEPPTHPHRARSPSCSRAQGVEALRVLWRLENARFLWGKKGGKTQKGALKQVPPAAGAWGGSGLCSPSCAHPGWAWPGPFHPSCCPMSPSQAIPLPLGPSICPHQSLSNLHHQGGALALPPQCPVQLSGAPITPKSFSPPPNRPHDP